MNHKNSLTDEEYGEIFGVDNSPAMQRAFSMMMLEYGGDDLFTEFLSLVADNGGDISRIGAKTHETVSIREFVEDPYFLGVLTESLWETTKEDVINCIEQSAVEYILTGGIGVAKSTRAYIVNAYYLYLVSAEINPQLTFGILPNDKLVMCMLNKTEKLAYSVTYMGFRSLIESIPYFKENYLHNQKLESRMDFKNKVSVIYGAAYSDNILGMNVFSGVIDELNFMNKILKSKQAADGGEFNQAKNIYATLVRRIKSRFDMKSVNHYGVIALVSSKDSDDDFTSNRIREVKEQEKKLRRLTYISDVAQWEMLPKYNADGTLRYCGDKFTVAIGNKRYPSEIVKIKGEWSSSMLGVDHTEDDRVTLDVPIELLTDFQDDIEGALRDFAGKASRGSLSFITNVAALYATHERFDDSPYERLFAVDEWCLDEGMPPLNPKYRVYNKTALRCMHIDLGHTQDRCGISFGHSISDRVKVAYGVKLKERAPEVIIDDAIGINAPKNGEIIFADVRKLVYYLRDSIGIPIKYVTLDGFNSIDTLQILAAEGFDTSYLSVSGHTAYSDLRDAITSGRILIPNNEILFDEFIHLEQDPKTKIVDHTATSTNDIADATCGVYSKLMKLYAEGLLHKGTGILTSLYTNNIVTDEGIVLRTRI